MKKQNNTPPIVPIELVNEAQSELIQSLQTDPKYALEPDPFGTIGLSTDEKNFIKWYIQYRNIPLASQLAGIDEAKGTKFYTQENCRSEIRRINLALYARQFSRRLLTIDEVGGYLTSLLVDQDVAERDKLPTKDKLAVAKMIIDLNKLKQDAFGDPKKVEAIEIQGEVKDMSVEELKSLIEKTKGESRADKKEQTAKYDEKSFLINQLNTDVLDPSEIAYLQTLSVEELKSLVEEKGVEDEQAKTDSTENLSVRHDQEGE